MPQALQLRPFESVLTQTAPHLVSDGRHAHVDAPLQYSPLAHAVPQTPQFSGSAVVSWQSPPQNAVPVGHVHAPPAQLPKVPHVFPQPPQFFESVVGSTHAPLQMISVEAEQPQTPAVHFAPVAGHFEPQPPQFATSVLTSMHSPPQVVAPTEHLQAPASQLPAGPQALPHAPQLAPSVFMSTHLPAHTT